MSQSPKDSPPFWENRRNRLIMWSGLIGACLVTMLLEFFIHPKHSFGFMGFPVSSAVLGFVACSLMILASKGLGMFLKKKEDYYDKDELF
jgi:hypothetical protein